ncbi:MAG: hypothetical protein AAF721_17180, partial [Myxococcota bacterium]
MLGLCLALGGCFADAGQLLDTGGSGESGTDDAGTDVTTAGSTHGGSDAPGETGPPGSGSDSTGIDSGSTDATGGSGETGGSADSTTASDDTGSTSTGDTDSGSESESGDTGAIPVDCTAGGADPILWLTFDDDVNNDGSLGAEFDGVASNAGYVPGVCGQALSLATDGDTNVVVANTVEPLSASADYTIALWFREDVVQPGTLLDFRAQDSVADIGGGLVVYHGASDEMTVCASASPGGTLTCRSFPYTVGDWHHLLLRCDGDGTEDPDGCDVELFLDNVLLPLDTLVANGVDIFSPDQADD